MKNNQLKKNFVIITSLFILFFLVFFYGGHFFPEISRTMGGFGTKNMAGVLDSIDSNSDEISTSTPDETSTTAAEQISVSSDEISTSTPDQVSTLFDQILTNTLDQISTLTEDVSTTTDQSSTSSPDQISTSTEDVSTSTSEQTSTTTPDEVSTTTPDEISTTTISETSTTTPDEISTSTLDDQISTTTIDEISTSTEQIATTTSEKIILPPKVTDYPLAVKSVSSPILKGTFHSGVVPIVVTFNKSVLVSGTPRLILSTGEPSTTAVDLKYSSANRLYFLYHIVPGNSAFPLDYVSSSALDLNGGSIKDSSGGEANLNLPNPGSAGSLSAKSQITIEASQ